jgi:hypothetical protein
VATLLVATTGGLHEVADRGGRVHLKGRDVTAVSGLGWALLEGREVVHCEHGRWAPYGEVPDGERATCLEVGPHGVLLGTEGAGLLRRDDEGVHRVPAFDEAPGRDGWYTPWGGPPDVRSIAAAPDGPIVGVHVGGVWRPEGDRWVEAVPVEADDHQVVASGKTVVVAAGVGVGQSEDGGRTWDWHDDGLHGSYCRAAALAEGWVIVSASSGPGAKRSALYRRPLDAPGRPFMPCGDGLPQGFAHQIDTFELAAAGNVAALGTPAGELFASQDSGATWARIADTLPGVRCVALNS